PRHDAGGGASGARRVPGARRGRRPALRSRHHRQGVRRRRRAALGRAALAQRASEPRAPPRLRAGAAPGWRRRRALPALAATAMTPFGVRLRQLRAERGISLKQMAEALGVSAAYLSALEHGRRGRPTHAMVVAICAHLNIIWDEADELHRLARL